MHLYLGFSSSGLSLCSGASMVSACPWVTVLMLSMAAGGPGAHGLPARGAAVRVCRAPRGSAATPRKCMCAFLGLFSQCVYESSPRFPDGSLKQGPSPGMSGPTHVCTGQQRTAAIMLLSF